LKLGRLLAAEGRSTPDAAFFEQAVYPCRQSPECSSELSQSKRYFMNAVILSKVDREAINAVEGPALKIPFAFPQKLSS